MITTLNDADRAAEQMSRLSGREMLLPVHEIRNLDIPPVHLAVGADPQYNRDVLSGAIPENARLFNILDQERTREWGPNMQQAFSKTAEATAPQPAGLETLFTLKPGTPS